MGKKLTSAAATGLRRRRTQKRYILRFKNIFDEKFLFSCNRIQIIILKLVSKISCQNLNYKSHAKIHSDTQTRGTRGTPSCPPMPTTLGTKFKILFEVWTFDSLLNLTFENWFCLIFSDFLHVVKWFFWSCWFFDVWKKDLWFWWLLILTAVAFFFKHFSSTKLAHKSELLFEVSTIRKKFQKQNWLLSTDYQRTT